jgi:hypothetical protein
MNQFLAEMYGTRETIGAPAQSDDTEKLAEAQLLDDALRAENIDVDTLSPEAILKVAHSLFGDDSALVKAAAEEGHEEGETEAEEKKEEEAKKEGEGESAEEKTAQADFLGRVMAHAFVQEQAEINKEAGAKELAEKAWGGIKALPGHVKGGPKAISEKLKAMKKSYHSGTAAAGGAEGRAAQQTAGGRLAGLKRMGKEHPKSTAAAGIGALGLSGGAAAGAHKAFGEKKKAASALDMLAEQRALSLLKEAGMGNSEEEKLAEAVEQRAWEMLAENGYVAEE